MHRFFVEPESITQNTVIFPLDISRQMKRVLRLKPDTIVCALDNKGYAYETKLVNLDDELVMGEVVRSYQAQGEPKLKLTMCLSLTQREKFEWMVQKCVEIGVYEIRPVISERTLVRNLKEADQKLDRWQKIAKEAAEQSHRALIPQIAHPVLFRDMIQTTEAKKRLFFWEEEKTEKLSQALGRHPDQLLTAAAAIGPEGGFSLDEAKLAREAGWTFVTMGERILRVETAALVSAALTIYETERN